MAGSGSVSHQPRSSQGDEALISRRIAGTPNQSLVTSAATLDNLCRIFYLAAMAETTMPDIQTGVVEATEDQPKSTLEPGYLVVCWDDPVNLMDYVTRVFQIVFGWPKQKAEYHMLQVHQQGKSVLARESLERAEHYVHQLQKFSLHATMERD